MTPLASLLLVLLGLGAGMLGAMAGIGGGILIVPTLVIFFHVPLPMAIGTSLVAVIATSTATSSVHLERHRTDARLGITLELATTIGAAIAAVIAQRINRTALALLFVGFLSYSAIALLRRAWNSRSQPQEDEPSAYQIHRYPAGLGVAAIAGAMSGLLGIGGGPIMVPAMYLVMGVPLRIAAATSNFMIGATALSSAFIYYGHGNIRLDVSGPLLTGVFLGSFAGAYLAPRVRVRFIQLLLVAVMIYLAVQMLFRVMEGKVS
jgi:uncharacterized membrane protein YfcA